MSLVKQAPAHRPAGNAGQSVPLAQALWPDGRAEGLATAGTSARPAIPQGEDVPVRAGAAPPGSAHPPSLRDPGLPS